MKRTILRVALGLAGFLVVALAAVLIYVSTALPNVGPPPDLTVEGTPEQVERGKYLANNVMLCMDCHGKRQWAEFGGPPEEGTLGMGGEVFPREAGFPGHFVAPNITPAALADWTDGEIFRAITTGVSKDGRALFNVMPYQSYAKLDREDIEAVIAYLRTVSPVENKTAPSEFDFPVNFIINTIPQPASFAPRPDPSDQLAYGKYLVTAGACYDCHTNQEKGTFVGEPFAGGMNFPLPDGSVVTSANITPDPTTGIGNWTESQFVTRFKQYADSSYVSPTIAAGDFQTFMPWTMYAGMTETDLKAMFAYLKSLEPVDNEVEIFASSLED
ncbi:c-type cytochrome [Lewinella sp. W8]|uniref:c-type cytochrome n=1 Tax=Lewinella sp. W8 TaxID=2528208 RepID=UPI001067803B|nr:c-type cytochrome [Lewinella sp. W8]MTB51216.1 c-type cytochrome [Lewinella sp. W8]